MVTQKFLEKMIKLIKEKNPEALATLRRMSHKKQHEVLIARDKIGWTLTHWAIYQGNLAMARSFIAMCMDPNIAVSVEETTGVGFFHGNETMLHIALRYACYADGMGAHGGYNDELAILLLDYGANPKACDQNRQTALHWACGSKCFQVVQRILSTQPELLYEQDKRGNTCLHVAVEHRRVAIARLLLDKGDAKLLMLRNNENQRALDLPESKDLQDLFQRRSVRHKDHQGLAQDQEEGIYQQNNAVCLFKEAKENTSVEKPNKRRIETKDAEIEINSGKRAKSESKLNRTPEPK